MLEAFGAYPKICVLPIKEVIARATVPWFPAEPLLEKAFYGSLDFHKLIFTTGKSILNRVSEVLTGTGATCSNRLRRFNRRTMVIQRLPELVHNELLLLWGPIAQCSYT